MRSTGHMRQRTPGSWELRYTLGTFQRPVSGGQQQQQ
jgi:hypothetical protein